MQITERRIGEAVILDLVGELTYTNRATFKASVERSKASGVRHLILNMQGVRFLDSSALGTLALLTQSLSATRSTMGLLNPQSYVKEILTLANLNQLLPVYYSEEEALAACHLPKAG
jgi:anti-anti-sigma factor